MGARTSSADDQIMLKIYRNENTLGIDLKANRNLTVQEACRLAGIIDVQHQCAKVRDSGSN